MAFLHLHSPPFTSHPHPLFPPLPRTLTPSIHFRPRPLTSIGIAPLRRRRGMAVAGVKNESEEGSEREPETESEPEVVAESELASELKKAMEERKEKEGEELLSGVVKEVGEIEWPALGKVLSTSGVVIGVIFGSSVVLLTVNAIFAELSDKVFAGKGVQDFFT